MAERPRELGDFKKARVNGGTNNHSLKDSHKCLRYTADRPASYGNQIVSSTRPITATYICRRYTVGVIHIAADHQMFIALAGERS